MLGIVIIGRNEGQRLIDCVSSIPSGYPIVYVDSDSSDGSDVAVAQMGVEVIKLPLDRPFTAGRARNFGFARLLEKNEELEFVQFVDGDCQIADNWIEKAQRQINEESTTAIVFGQRSERRPEKSLYNRLCDIEWGGSAGFTGSCGGDFLCRASVFAEVGGFNERLIAGEEPEMCHRITSRGWQIYRLDEAMTWHDAEIYTFRQWARRSSRSGYAYAARCFMHWQDGTHYCWRENLRIVFWALLLPISILILATLASPWAGLLFGAYVVQYFRLKAGMKSQDEWAYPLFLVIGNWTEFSGQARCAWRLLLGKEERIIEYK